MESKVNDDTVRFGGPSSICFLDAFCFFMAVDQNLLAYVEVEVGRQRRVWSLPNSSVDMISHLNSTGCEIKVTPGKGRGVFGMRIV